MDQRQSGGMSNGSHGSSPWNAIIGHIMDLSAAIGHLKGSHETHVSQTNHRLTALEQWRWARDREREKTASALRSMATNGHGLEYGTRTPREAELVRKKRLKLMWIIIEKAASVGPTALHVIWWVISRIGAAWLFMSGPFEAAWQTIRAALGGIF